MGISIALFVYTNKLMDVSTLRASGLTAVNGRVMEYWKFIRISQS